jgi:CheY-like chemotaxis protein
MPNGDGSDMARVLFIEDSAEEIRVMTQLLDRAHVQFEGHWVRSGEDALRFLHRETGFEGAPRPDLVFLDLNLPRIGGNDVLHSIKSEPAMVDIPVVILSGSDFKGDVVKARDHGAVHYLVKPLTYEKLCEAVARTRTLRLSAEGDDLILYVA